EARISGCLEPGVGAKDLILALIGKIGTAGAAGHVVEYTGAAVRALSMEERMTVCNMSIEAGARAGMIAPDEVTFAYLEGRPRAPQEAAWTAAVERWQTFRSDPDARYDAQVQLDASQVGPQVTWGTTPGMVADITARVPDPAQLPAESDRQAAARALEYMGLVPGTPLEGIPIDRVFLGSCTNARIEDLRAAASVVRGRHVAARVRAMVVPGSQRVKAQAEREGLDRGFSEGLFLDWRADPNFELNRPEARGATILVTGPNFGCGSSREHAVWALAQSGFRAIIAPSFADIFLANCYRNGVLPVQLSPLDVDTLIQRAAGGSYEIAVDLEQCVVSDDHGFSARFTADPYGRELLLKGLDEI